MSRIMHEVYHHEKVPGGRGVQSGTGIGGTV